MSDFAFIESCLQEPAATGLMIVDTSAEPGVAAELGLERGAILTKLAGEPLTGYVPLLQRLGELDESATIPIEWRRPDGSTAQGNAPRTLRRFRPVEVTQGQPAWIDPAASPSVPIDHAGLPPVRSAGPVDWVFRSHFGEETVGYEWFRFTNGTLGEAGWRVDHTVDLGGGSGDEAWEYRARSITDHHADDRLSIARSEFRLGADSDGVDRYEYALVADGSGWQGTISRNGKPAESVSRPATEEQRRPVNIYAIPMLAVGMPLEAGATAIVPTFDEVGGTAGTRSALRCTGRATVDVAGTPTEAWEIAWLQYGHADPSSPAVERFFVDGQRRLVRMDWGTNYNNCWCVRVDSPDEITPHLPGHLSLPCFPA